MSGYHYDPMLWPAIGSAAFIGTIGGYLWRRRAETKGALVLAILAMVLVIWCLAGAAESAATEFTTQRTWFIFRDALTLPGVVLAFYFALQYSGLERWLTRPVAALLVAVIVGHVALEFVDGGRLLWSSIEWDGEVQGERAGLGLVFAAFALGMFLLSTAVFLLLFVRSPAHRVPVAMILLGQVALRVIYPLTTFNVVYVPNIVAGIVGFDFVAAMYAIALFRFRMFDLVPVARETILARMPEGLLVLDPQGRTVDLNTTARRLLGAPDATPARSRIGDSVRLQPELVAAVTGNAGVPREVVLETDAGPRTCQVATTELADWQGRPIGRLVLLHDITELRAAEDRLLEQERSLAIARERERQARDLHDSVGQVLGYLGLQAAAIRKLSAAGRSNDVDDRLRRVAAIASDAQADVRRTISELSSSPSGDPDFVAALQRRLGTARRDYGVSAELDVDGPIDELRLPPEAASHLLRIVDEALSNAIRHGEAHNARVSLTWSDTLLSLSIEDDGTGFDVPPVIGNEDGRYGLRFMHERAAELEGELEVASVPGQGTRVSVRIPLARATAEAALR